MFLEGVVLVVGPTGVSSLFKLRGRQGRALACLLTTCSALSDTRLLDTPALDAHQIQIFLTINLPPRDSEGRWTVHRGSK